MSTQCWICGNSVMLTGEHLIKKSDLKAEFSKGPLYLHTEKQRNNKIQGLNAKKLKSDAQICAYCNNNRTQPFDRAWEKLSNYLQSIKQPIQSGKHIKLNKIFHGIVNTSMLNVHLYFIKLFGCKIRESNIPIDLRPFSYAILHNMPHNNVYIAICPKLTGNIGHTTVVPQLDNFTGKIVFAVWLYELCQFSIRIMFADPKQHQNGLKDAWHPSTMNKYIKIAK